MLGTLNIYLILTDQKEQIIMVYIIMEYKQYGYQILLSYNVSFLKNPIKTDNRDKFQMQ